MHGAVSGWAQGVPPRPRSPALDAATPTPLSHSSMTSPSPAVLLLVLEEEREMLARPFSFNFMKGLRGNRKAGSAHTPRAPPRPSRD